LEIRLLRHPALGSGRDVVHRHHDRLAVRLDPVQVEVRRQAPALLQHEVVPLEAAAHAVLLPGHQEHPLAPMRTEIVRPDLERQNSCRDLPMKGST